MSPFHALFQRLPPELRNIVYGSALRGDIDDATAGECEDQLIDGATWATLLQIPELRSEICGWPSTGKTVVLDYAMDCNAAIANVSAAAFASVTKIILNVRDRTRTTLVQEDLAVLLCFPNIRELDIRARLDIRDTRGAVVMFGCIRTAILHTHQSLRTCRVQNTQLRDMLFEQEARRANALWKQRTVPGHQWRQAHRREAEILRHDMDVMAMSRQISAGLRGAGTLIYYVGVAVALSADELRTTKVELRTHLERERYGRILEVHYALPDRSVRREA
ncbi:hypothetical protein LTR85_007252 [Meristemomyces frigidus]|nr:hypothetical protein LTR85_007252 [Meristemomyces frigidus]